MATRTHLSDEAPTTAAPAPHLGMQRQRPFLAALLASMRPRQWTKNLIIFTGVAFALRLNDPVAVSQAVLAFAAFCLLSSAGYLINDVLDAAADRQHPTKRLRPIASGELRPRPVIVLALGAVAVALLLLLQLGPLVAAAGAGYAILTLTYSSLLKHIVLIDLFAIAGGFVLRVIGGALAVGVPVSSWLYVCTVLLALFLGLAKRRQELTSLAATAAHHRRSLSDYTVDLVDQLMTTVMASIIMGYSLYTFSAPNLPKNDAMMATIPLVMYGLFRYQYLVRVRGLGGSPEDLLLSDRPMLTTVALWGALSLVVLYFAR